VGGWGGGVRCSSWESWGGGDEIRQGGGGGGGGGGGRERGREVSPVALVLL